jgi:hypothetical protein
MVTYTVTATDADDDEVSFSISGQPDWISFQSPDLTFEPDGESETTEIEIIADDGNEGFDTLVLTVTVEHTVSVVTHSFVPEKHTFLIGNRRLEILSLSGEVLGVALYSLEGSRIVSRRLENTGDAGSLNILPAGGIVPGIYIVKLQTTMGTGMRKANIR